MRQLTLNTWERKFRSDARADKLARFRTELRRLEADEAMTANSMLNATVLVVHACAAYAGIDGQPVSGFLGNQTYDPAQSPATAYSFTFDI